MGANCALRIAGKELADVVLVDVVDGVPQGKGLDLLESGPVEGYDVSITGANDYGPTANSDIVIITAGFPRKPGMSRDDLLIANYEVVKIATEQAVKASPNAILILVTNPLDAMRRPRSRSRSFPGTRVIGMAGVFDTARFRTFIAQELGVSVENVTAVVLGGHGDTMVPMVRLTSVSGIPLTRTDGSGHHRPARGAHAQRRRRDREVSEDRQRLLRAIGGRGGNGRIHPEGQEEGAAVRRVSGRRIRNQGAVRRRARASWARSGIEKIYEIKLQRRRAGRVTEERGRREGTGGRDQDQDVRLAMTAIAPLLSVRNGARAIEFYKAAFGAAELFRIDDPGSGDVVAHLSVAEAEFWVADESPENQNFSPESLGGGTVRMVMTVDDPDAAFERAVGAGATVVWPVSNQYGWRLGRIVDPFGHHWEIGKPDNPKPRA